jgi:uncharacterized integral membrane protein
MGLYIHSPLRLHGVAFIYVVKHGHYLLILHIFIIINHNISTNYNYVFAIFSLPSDTDIKDTFIYLYKVI